MIVEDERIIAEDIRRTLISFDYEVVAMAATGERAIELAEKHQPDMILMDIMLEGDMRGTEAGKIIYRKWGIPIIFLTAYADVTTLMNAKNTEPFGYVVKPFEERELRATIEMGLKRHMAEQSIKARGEHFRQLFESNPAIYQSLDIDGNLTTVNQNWVDLFGYTQKEVEHKPFTDFLEDTEKELFPKRFERFLREGTINDKVYSMKGKDGREILVSFNGNVQYDSNGDFKLAHCILTDITHLRQNNKVLIETGDRYRTLFESTTDAILLMKDAEIVECNTRCEELFHCKKDALIGQEIFRFCPQTQPTGEDSQTAARQYILISSRGKMQQFEWQHVHYDGTPFDSEVILKSITIGGEKYVQAIVKDITEEKRQGKIQKTLFNISNAVHTANDLPELFGFIKEELSAIINTENFYVALYDQDRDMLSFPLYLDEKEEFEEAEAANSLTGYVIKSGKPLLATQKEIHHLEKLGYFKIHGTVPFIWLGVPLFVDDIPIGLIGLQSYSDPYLYTEKDVEMLEVISGQIATVIAKKMATEKLQLRNRQMSKLFEAAKKLATTLDIKEVLSVISAGAAELLQADRVTNYLLDEDGVILNPVLAIDPTYQDEVLSAKIQVDDSLTGMAIQQKRSIIFNDSGINEASAKVSGAPTQADERMISSPLIVDDEIIGAMNIMRNGTPFDENELTLADTYAAFASTAIKNAGIYQKMQQEMEERIQGEKVQSLLYHISNAALETQDISELIHQIKEILGELIDTTNMYVALYQKESDTFSLPFISDERDDFNTFPMGRTLTAYTIKSRKAQLLTEREIIELEKQGIVDSVGTPSKIWMGIPLIINDEVMGLVGLQNYENEKTFTLRDVRVMEIVSGQIASAIQRKQAEEQAKEQKAYTDQLFDSSPLAIVLADNDSNILAVNREFENIFGYSAAEILHKNVDSLVVADEKMKEARAITEKVKHGERQIFETIRKRKDGSTVDVSIIGTPVVVDGKQVAVFGLYTDITQRKESEQRVRESEARFRDLFEESPISLWEQDVSEVKHAIDRLVQQESITDFGEYLKEHNDAMVDLLSKIKVVNLNRQTMELYDALDKDDLKEKYGMVFDTQSDGILREALTALANDEKEFEGVGINKTLRGERLFVSMKWSIPSDYSRALLSVVDITQLKEAEAEREKVITDLKKALKDVKTLSGLIPICASCKKIRNDQGYWTSVEEFIAKNSDVDFSHAICPDCMKKQYPKVYDRMVREGKIKPEETHQP